ncbi:helix-turn-helix domain-containing protein [Streptomyces sp. NPDC042319]|uniref:helix-turn-helix domain-containing protein n=1 Tax=Streptomyces sp. NPDC042319 TaxID=3154332 RepID=UPI0033CFA33A
MTIDKSIPRAEKRAREHTLEDRNAAVMRAIRLMRENMNETLPVPRLANSALLSPFHFHRTFRDLTTSTPARFLAALRMAEAKRQLVYTPRSVTDICADVGYSSLSTFSAQFTRLVGIPPSRFRRLVAPFADLPFNTLLAQLQPMIAEPASPQASATVFGDADDGALAAVGLFRASIPQEAPSACAIVAIPGVATFSDLSDDDYSPLAMSFPSSTTVADALVGDDSEVFLVAASPVKVRIREGQRVTRPRVPLRLRPRVPTDPPVVIALPLLMAAEAVHASGPSTGTAQFACTRAMQPTRRRE